MPNTKLKTKYGTKKAETLDTKLAKAFLLKHVSVCAERATKGHCQLGIVLADKYNQAMDL